MANRVNTETKSEGGVIRFVSWNVKGLNGPVKRDRIFSNIKALRAEVIFLQEMHLRNIDHIGLVSNRLH